MTDKPSTLEWFKTFLADELEYRDSLNDERYSKGLRLAHRLLEAAEEKYMTDSKRKHWYRIHIYTCPVCGHTEEERERVYGDRPTVDEHRIIHHDLYDNCIEWGGLT